MAEFAPSTIGKCHWNCPNMNLAVAFTGKDAIDIFRACNRALLQIPTDELDEASCGIVIAEKSLGRDITHSTATQRLSELVDARNERVADGSVSEYGDGATELMTQQAQLAAEELSAPQSGSQMRQKGAE